VSDKDPRFSWSTDEGDGFQGRHHSRDHALKLARRVVDPELHPTIYVGRRVTRKESGIAKSDHTHEFYVLEVEQHPTVPGKTP
jgi:hypothetical protein